MTVVTKKRCTYSKIVASKLRIRVVKQDFYWKIEASVSVHGKWMLLIRQGEYDTKKEAGVALAEKLKREKLI